MAYLSSIINFRLKAIVYSKYGGINVLELRDIEKPLPKHDEVLVKNHAVSINDWDLGLLHGDFVNRMLNGVLKPKRKVLGSDIAGTVEVIGNLVKKFRVGDEVYGDVSGRWGGFAEYTLASEDALELKPKSMSFEQAAAIPQAAMLAVQGLIDTAQIKKGQTLLINGAGGGVGTFGVQIAKVHGLEVTGVDHRSKLDMMRAVGFDHVIDYTAEDFTDNGKRYDVILDAKTNRPIGRYLGALNDYGMYVTVGGSIDRLLQAFLFGKWFSSKGKKVRIVALKPNKDLQYINKLFESGHFKPVIDGPFTIDEFEQAFSLYGNAEHKGKVVLSF